MDSEIPSQLNQKPGEQDVRNGTHLKPEPIARQRMSGNEPIYVRYPTYRK